MGLAARHLEANGLPTLCLGSAHDILAAAAPPRAAFVDYPLGHSAGKPFDRDDQYRVLRAALQAFESISRPGTMLTIEGTWTEPDWKSNAMPVSAGDTRMPRDTSPQYQTAEDRRLAEEMAGS